jgi:hypothetical protein
MLTRLDEAELIRADASEAKSLGTLAAVAARIDQDKDFVNFSLP